ncbi:carbohydrate ABC transporter membrane protein 2 (CUT1 family) [Herbihabitans rhizosphaerae]|uniref:Carbohydrate ABC transporter membrane protein 2 (CUT1 family) n=1 Tax=Herbihabitans rhizosphaerae TaxID=1872711 RepID=A0A4Q7L5C6_9PSEU|nr:carbohydrate ABC transporter permease [Herbihabitans rhizosphaerae]RZS44849.1 carbohydrate ABC transporter membrane protein 2 (CUT1 family) [Herbihabitans rhizosphaerae]
MTTLTERLPSTVDAPRPPKRGRGQRKRWELTAVGVIVALVFLFPYIVMLIGSLKSRPEILQVPPTYLPQEWHPENYVNMWNTPETPLGSNLLSTVVISLGGTALALLAALPAAYFTARHNFRLKMPFLLLVLITQMLQPTVLASGLFREFVTLGLNDTLFSMILVNAAFNLSFAVWIMHSFFRGVPKEIEEAAWLDGCTRTQSMRRVMLPLVWPGIVTTVIFTFIACWNEFAASLILLPTDTNQPLTVALTKFVGQYDSAWQYVFGVSLIGILPVVILFSMIEKHLVAGLTAGGVK